MGHYDTCFYCQLDVIIQGPRLLPGLALCTYQCNNLLHTDESYYCVCVLSTTRKSPESFHFALFRIPFTSLSGEKTKTGLPDDCQIDIYVAGYFIAKWLDIFGTYDKMVGRTWDVFWLFLILLIWSP